MTNNRLKMGTYSDYSNFSPSQEKIKSRFQHKILNKNKKAE